METVIITEQTAKVTLDATQEEEEVDEIATTIEQQLKSPHLIVTEKGENTVKVPF